MAENKAFETSVKGLKNDSQAYERTITPRPAPGEYIVPFEQAPGDQVCDNGDNFIHFDIRGRNDGKEIAQVGDKKIRYVDFA